MLPLGTLASSRVAAAGPLVFDSFNRADSASTLGNADTGQAWSAVVGTWGITSNRAYPVTASGTGTAAINTGLNPAATPMQVSAYLHGFTTGNYPVLFLGGATGNNHQSGYRLYPDGSLTRATLQDRTSSAVFTSGAALVSGDLFTLRSVPNGANCDLTLLINGVSRATLTAAALTGTWCGIGTGNSPDTACRFEDFTVEDLT
jgi:hypothetical protein